MKYFIKIISLIGLFTISQFAYSASVTDTYTTGDTLTADTLNNLKSAVNNNDTRVNILESLTPGVSPDYSGYGLPFSADGSPKNVVILATDDFTSTRYAVRVFYANSGEQVSVEGVPVVRPFIANYFNVEVDAGGNLTVLQNYIEAPLTKAYEDFVVEESTYNVNTLVKTVDNDTRSEVWDYSGSGATRVHNVVVKASGTMTDTFISPRVYSLLGAGEFNTIPFDNLRGENRTYITGAQYRVSAKGLGEVMRLFPGSSNRPRAAIYYRVDGQTGGSLAGTIFAPGEKLDGVLF